MQDNTENEQEQNRKSALNIEASKKSLKQITLLDLAVVDMLLVGRDTILVADYNKRLLVFDAGHPEKTMREIKLTEKPYGLTIVDEMLVAASVGHTKFQIIDMQSEKILQTTEVNLISETSESGDNDPDEEIQTGYDIHCIRLWGLAYFNREFYFAAKNRILKVNDHGTSCETVLEIQDGWMFCIKIHNERIFVTDNKRGYFVCLTLLGDIIFEFKPQGLNRPYGLTLDSDESFLVADLLGNQIHKIKLDGSSSTVVLSSNGDLVHPRSVLFLRHLGFYLIACDAGKKLFAISTVSSTDN